MQREMVVDDNSLDRTLFSDSNKGSLPANDGEDYSFENSKGFRVSSQEEDYVDLLRI